MYKKPPFYSIIIICCLLSSCMDKKINEFDFESNGKPVFNLSSTKYELDTIYSPKKIEVKGQKLIIIEDKYAPLEHPIIHILDKNNLKHLFSKGKNGYGPNEITDAHLYDPGFNDSTFWINSTISKRLAKYSLNNDNLLSETEFRQPQSMFVAYNVQMITDSSFMCLSANDKNKLVEYDINGKRIKGYGTWEPISDRPNLSNFQYSGINTGWLKTDKEHRYYVKACLYRDKIEIFDYQTKEFIEIIGPRMEIPPFQIAGRDEAAPAIYPQDTKYGYRDISFGKDNIYFLYSGYNYQEYMTNSTLAKTIYVLTKTGDVIAKINLDTSLRAFAVDENSNKIFGVTTDENPGIAVFTMPSF